MKATTVEVVGPRPLVWDFMQGPSTIGLVPRATRAARMDALRQVSDFAKLLGVGQVQTHCGFIPEDPADPLYPEAVAAIREVAKHCAGNGQDFLMETGQETPTTMSRMLRDVAQPNLGVGLDTANLILYGKANPVDAVDILGPHVKSIHAKDGRWPTDPSKLGEEVLIGTGLVDFHKVFAKLHHLGIQRRGDDRARDLRAAADCGRARGEGVSGKDSCAGHRLKDSSGDNKGRVHGKHGPAGVCEGGLRRQDCCC